MLPENGYALEYVLIRVHFEHHYSSNHVDLFTVNIDFSDDAYSAFSSYKQVLQVITSVVLVDF